MFQNPPGFAFYYLFRVGEKIFSFEKFFPRSKSTFQKTKSSFQEKSSQKKNRKLFKNLFFFPRILSYVQSFFKKKKSSFQERGSFQKKIYAWPSKKKRSSKLSMEKEIFQKYLSYG